MIYKTTYMLGSIKALAHANRCVWVTKSYACKPAIPLPLRRLKDLPFFLYSRFKQASYPQVDLWHEKGGILVSQSSLERICDSRIGAHDAAFFVECPLSIDTFLRNTEHTRGDIVIYQPPRWDEHQAVIDERSIPIDRVKEGWEFLQGRLEGARALATDSELESATGVPGNLMRRALIGLQSYREAAAYLPITLRFPPDDAIQLSLYRFLEQQPTNDKGQHVVIDWNIYREWNPRWKPIYKRMMKEGCLSVGERTYIFHPKKIVNWIKADNYRLVTQGEFDAMRDLVQEAPLYRDLEILAGPPYAPT